MDLLSANLSEDLPGQRNAGVGKERGVSDCVPDRGQTEAGGGGSRPERRGGGRWQGDPGQGEDRMGARDVRQRGTASVVGAGDLWRAIAVAVAVDGGVEGGSERAAGGQSPWLLLWKRRLTGGKDNDRGT